MFKKVNNYSEKRNDDFLKQSFRKIEELKSKLQIEQYKFERPKNYLFKTQAKKRSSNRD